MRRVLLVGSAVAVGDGLLLGSAIAFGWTVLVLLAITAGAVGTLAVAMLTPPPRTPARPATVTLGLPLRETAAEPEEATAGEGAVAADDPLAYPAAPEREPAGAVVGRPAPVAA